MIRTAEGGADRATVPEAPRVGTPGVVAAAPAAAAGRRGVLSRIGFAVERTATVLATLLFATVVCAFVWSVVSRYLMGDPSRYGEETAIVAYLWVVMIGAGLACGIKDHVSLDIFVDALPPRAAGVATVLGAAIAGGLMLALLPTTVDYVQFLWRERTPAMRLRLDLVYACFPVFQGAIGLRLAIHAVREAARLRRRPA